MSDRHATPRPRWRGHVHTWAFVATLPVILVLLLAADHRRAQLVLAVFGGSLLGVYGISAVYHRLARSPGVRRVMQRLDHSMIFVLFAATYTAVAVTSLDGLARTVLLVTVWSLTAVSIGIKVRCGDRALRNSNVLYAVLTAPAFLALPVLVQSLPVFPFALLVLGGGFYIAGALVFYRGRPDPSPLVFGYHEIWHVFTVLAGTAHLGMVAVLA
ncbi:MAG: PAQR family membrane homeostasis protein TrhA [Acidimicrobiales bacterium]